MTREDVIAGQEWAGGALVRESERLRALLEHAEEVNGELTIKREELRAENKALQDQAFDLTERLLQCSAEIERLRAALERIAKDSYRDGHVAWATEALGSWQR